MATRKVPEELVVITKTYDLILWSCNHIGRFPRTDPVSEESGFGNSPCVLVFKPAGHWHRASGEAGAGAVVRLVSKPVVDHWREASGDFRVPACLQLLTTVLATAPQRACLGGSRFGNYTRRQRKNIPSAPPASRRWLAGLETMEPIYTANNVTPAYQLNWRETR